MVTIALSIYAWTTKVDINILYGLVFVFYLAMIPCMIVCIFMQLAWVRTLYCVLGLLFYSVFLIIDTKKICETNKTLGGHALSMDDYVIGALQLYLDIVMIFVYILQLMGNKN